METESGVNRLINMFIDDMYALRGELREKTEEIEKLRNEIDRLNDENIKLFEENIKNKQVEEQGIK